MLCAERVGSRLGGTRGAGDGRQGSVKVPMVSSGKEEESGGEEVEVQ